MGNRRVFPSVTRPSRPVATTQQVAASITTPSTTPVSAAIRTSRPGRPRRSPRGQRGRKAYTITASGRARLHELLTTLDPADDRTFVLQVAFASHLDTAERLAVLGQRRGELTARLERSSAADEPADPWRASLRRHTVAAVAADLAWVDSLLAGEDTRTPSTTTTRSAEPAGSTTGGTP